MMRYSRPLIGAAALALLAIAFFARAGANPLVAEETPRTTFSGTLEARQTRVSAEVNARAVTVSVSKGSAVKTGDVLVSLDASTITSSIAEAESAVRTAQANLDQVNERARPGAIALAQSNIKQAQAELDATKKALDDANKALANPQDLTAQIHATEGRVSASEGDVAAAQAKLALIKIQLDKAQSDQSMSGKYQVDALQIQQVGGQASLAAAQTGLEGNRRVLDMYKQILANPLELQAAQHAADKQVKIAEAGILVAQRELDVVQRAAQPEAVLVAQTKLDAATANLNLLKLQLSRYSLASPVSGTVVDTAIETGESTRPGSAVITIADTTEYEMRLYIPIRNLSTIHVGQTTKIHVPSIPGKTYQGTVSYIAPQAEFKPANLYNSQDRADVVFSIRVKIPNPDNDLKAGLPADASFD